MEENKKINQELSDSQEETAPSEDDLEKKALENILEDVEERKVIVKNVTSFDYRTMKYLNLYIIKYKKKSFILYLVFSALTIGVAIYSFIDSYLNSEQPDFIFPIIFLLFAIYMLYQGITIEKALDKQLVNFFKSKQVTVQNAEFDEENLYIARGTKFEMGEAVKIDWVTVNEIHELPQYYYLFVGNNPIVIDKNPETFVEGTFEDFQTLIKEKITTRKYKKIDKDILKNPITYVHEEIKYVSKEEADHAEKVESVVIDNEAQTEEVENVHDEFTSQTTEDANESKDTNQSLDSLEE